MTGMQFSTPSPDTFVSNHASAIRPQYTGMSTQQSGFGNNIGKFIVLFYGALIATCSKSSPDIVSLGGMYGQQNPAFQQAQAANNMFPQSNQYNRGW